MGRISRTAARVWIALAVLGVGACILGAYGSASASADDPPGRAVGHTKHHDPHDPRFLYGDDDEDDAGPCDPTAGWQKEGGCDPADDLPGTETDDFINRVKDYAGPRYAGQWIDRAGGPRPTLMIGFTDQTRRDQEFLDSITGNDRRVRAVKQVFSTAELAAVTSVITSQPAQSMIGSDDRDNRVTYFVLVSDLEAARSQADAALRTSQDPLVRTAVGKVPGASRERLFRVVPWSGFRNTESRTTYPRHKGGRALTVDLANGYQEACTSAFTVETNASGAAAGLTAGHCARGYLVGGISIGSHYLARPGLNPYRASNVNQADAMRYGLPSPPDKSDNIFVNGVNRLNRDLQAPRHTSNRSGTPPRSASKA